MACRAVFAEEIQGVRVEMSEETGEEAMPRLFLNSDGVEFAHLLFLPQTAEFVFCLQLLASAEMSESIVAKTLEEVHTWVLRFSQLYR